MIRAIHTTATTNASGVATSSVFTANTTAGGPYTVVASASGAGSSANFSLTDANANNYVFYLSGADNLNTANPTNPTNYLALAGVVTIAPNGSVLGGEEDYNDANSTHGAGTCHQLDHRRNAVGRWHRLLEHSALITNNFEDRGQRHWKPSP